MRKTSPVLAAVAVCSLVLAGCGGGSSASGTSPSRYVHQVCAAAANYENQLKAVAGNFEKSAQSNATNLPALKQQFVALLTTAQNDTNNLKAKVSAAGTPAVSNGGQVRSSLLSTFSALATDFANAKTQASGLDASNAASFGSALQNLGTKIQTEASGLGSHLSSKEGLGGSQLNAAAQKDPACRAVGG
jgi:hypothetical protein